MPSPPTFPDDPRFAPLEIEVLSPVVDGGTVPAKRVVGDRVEVSARVFKDGHDLLAAAIEYRALADETWLEVPMSGGDAALFRGSFRVASNEPHEFRVLAWSDRFATWRHDMRRRLAAAQDVALELREGLEMVKGAAARASDPDRAALERLVDRASRAGDPQVTAELLLDADLAARVARHGERPLLTRSRPFPLWVDRTRARFASWYEFFPRSEGEHGAHGTFRTAIRRLPAIAAMGFDVVYLPPVHPIGRTARKGPDNSLVAGPADPGSPWAIGSEEGGHDAVNPQLGTLADFDAFVARASTLGLEVALDIALQCSPDHPWLRSHPEWFFHRPDGTIKYAENPPKKYQDIVPINFWGTHREALWSEVLRVFRFWIARGVRTFRVDNPHTKPLAMWAWVIAQIRVTDPDVIFLSEAFTAQWMMQALAKAGFSQSYTYFTWKTAAWELRDYLTELTQGPMREYFRANLWPNTPDILHEYLQHGPRRPAFKIRAVLAATLSPAWGIYSGYELMENEAVRAGSEEYLHSEKYELRTRDWDEPESLGSFVTKLNAARKAHRALQLYDNLAFVHADDPNVLAYVKSTPDKSDVVLTVVNVDAANTHATDLWIDPAVLGVGADEKYRVRDLLTGEAYAWTGGKNWVRLDPFVSPAHVFAIERDGGLR